MASKNHDVMREKAIPIKLVANDPEEERHQTFVDRFGSMLRAAQIDNLCLTEVLNINTREVGYMICGMMDFEVEGGDTVTEYIPVAELINPAKGQKFALPNGEGGWVGDPELEEGAGDETAQADAA